MVKGLNFYPIWNILIAFILVTSVEVMRLTNFNLHWLKMPWHAELLLFSALWCRVAPSPVWWKSGLAYSPGWVEGCGLSYREDEMVAARPCRTVLSACWACCFLILLTWIEEESAWKSSWKSQYLQIGEYLLRLLFDAWELDTFLRSQWTQLCGYFHALGK